MIQDLIGTVIPGFRETKSWSNNLIGSGLAVAAWGYFLYQGVVDPLGGINTLWPLFGISNQMLAGIALTLCTVVLFKMKRQKFAWVTIVPTLWLLACTLTAGLQKIFHPAPSIGFVAHARYFGDALATGKILSPAKSIAEMQKIVFNDCVDSALAAIFVGVVVAVLIYGLIGIRKALSTPNVTASEVGAVGLTTGGIHA
jgi:carbon starvation protein